MTILLLKKNNSQINHIFALLVTMIAAAVLQFYLFQNTIPNREDFFVFYSTDR